MNHQEITDQDAFRDSIATVDDSGKRVWMYPKKPSGRYYNARTWVSAILLLILFGLPLLKVNGQPFILLNVLERHFILFGIPFMPQDFHLFVLAMLTFIVGIVLFTVVFGRLFCGWVCPQTIFMEMVFRKIEYWIEGDANAQRRLNAAPWTRDKIIKKAGKQLIFFAIAVLVANTFLSYLIGLDQVVQIATEPVSMHLGGFIAMILFSFAFYFVFSYLREQVCIAICPYGRLQGVMLDRDSIVVHYDFERGEPRGKVKKKRAAPLQTAKHDPVATMAAAITGDSAEAESEKVPSLGDCIDCGLCVRVCPTGIDIRNGTQLECINCTACMDACDEIMDKVNRPRGLIRYDSYNGIVEKRNKIFTPRVIGYTAVLAALLILNIVLLTQRNQVEALLLRTPGTLYNEVDATTISNLYNYQIINKTRNELPVEFHLVNIPGVVEFVGNPPVAKPEGKTEGVLFIKIKTSDLTLRKTALELEARSGDKVVDELTTNFFGPGVQ